MDLATEGDAVPKLIYQDPETGLEMSLELGPQLMEMTIGRNPGNELRVNNPSISRKHARITYDMQSAQCTITDLKSSNGTYVNGARVQEQVLADGDRVRVGEFPFDYVEAQEGAAFQAAQEAPPRSPTSAGGFSAPQASPEPRPAPPYNGPGFDPSAGEDSPYGVPSYGQPQGPFGAKPYPPPVQDDGPPIYDPIAPGPEVIIGDEELDEVVAASEGLFSDYSEPSSSAEEGAFPRRSVPSSPGHSAGWNAVSPAGVASAAAVGAAVAVAGGDQQELLDRIEELERERDDLQEALEKGASDAGGMSRLQLERLRKERDRLSDERRTLTRQISDLKRDLEASPDPEHVERLERELEEERDQAGSFSEELKEARLELGERDALIASQQEQIEELERELSSMRDHYSATEESRLAAQQEKDRLIQTLQETQESLEQYQHAYEEARQSVEALDQSLEEHRQGIDERDRLSVERDTVIEELRAALDTHRVEIDGREDQIGELRADIDSKIEQIQGLSDRVDELSGELSARPLPEEVSRYRGDLGRLTEQLEALTQERDALTAQRDTLSQDLGDTRQVLEDIQARYDVIGDERDQYKRERDALKQEKGAFARETDYLQTEKRQLLEQVDKQRAQLDKFKQRHKQQKAAFGDMNLMIRDLRAQVGSLQTRTTELSEQLAASPSSEQIAAYEENLDQLEHELAGAREQILELEADNTDLTRNLGVIAEERDALQERLDQGDGAQSDAELLRKIEQLEQQLEQGSISEELEELSVERDLLRERVEQLEAKLSSEPNSGPLTNGAGALQQQVEQLERALEEVILQKDELERRFSEVN